jgi:hypothetical protein
MGGAFDSNTERIEQDLKLIEAIQNASPSELDLKTIII